TVCGFVWFDTNKDGFEDTGELGIEGVKVFMSDGTDTLQTDTGPDGLFYFLVPEGAYTIAAQTPQSRTPSPVDAWDDTVDSDGVPDGFGFSVAQVTVVGNNNRDTDFGFFGSAAAQQPGTGTPGYWKNHANAWPVQEIPVGGIIYTKAQAIAWLGK